LSFGELGEAPGLTLRDLPTRYYHQQFCEHSKKDQTWTFYDSNFTTNFGVAPGTAPSSPREKYISVFHFEIMKMKNPTSVIFNR
jgi:hypothetical protein